jgi:hypothetical protein
MTSVNNSFSQDDAAEQEGIAQLERFAELERFVGRLTKEGCTTSLYLPAGCGRSQACRFFLKPCLSRWWHSAKTPKREELAPPRAL